MFDSIQLIKTTGKLKNSKKLKRKFISYDWNTQFIKVKNYTNTLKFNESIKERIRKVDSEIMNVFFEQTN